MMRFRIVSVFLLLILSLHFTSCKTNTAELEQKFEKYQSDTPVVAVLDHSTFYFSDHTLSLSDLADGEDPNDGYLFMNGKLYFSTSKQNGALDYSFFVYECDVYGNNKTLVFENHGYKTHPWATGNNGRLYVEYYETSALDASTRKIDSYDPLSGVYENVSSGQVSSLSDYKKDIKRSYSWSFANGALSIVDTEKGEQYKIDDEVLQKSEFGKALDNLDFSYHSCHVMENGQIYLTYRIKSNGLPYPFFMCEFIPEKNEVVFQFLFFASDVENIVITSCEDSLTQGGKL